MLRLFAALMLAATMLRSRLRTTRIGDCLGAQCVIWLCGFSGGFISLAALRFHFPRVDEGLLALDRAFGLDAAGFAAWISMAPSETHRLLGQAYMLTVPLLLLSLLVQAALGRGVEVWRACFCFAGSLLAVSFISILTPAKGVGLWMSHEALARLPAGATRYHWAAFDRFYYGKEFVLRMSSINGVVSFPSFHIVMGLITVMLWRAKGWTLALALAWFAPMLVATVPFGGHYFVDLIGGLAVWAGWFALSRRLERTSAMKPLWRDRREGPHSAKIHAISAVNQLKPGVRT